MTEKAIVTILGACAGKEPPEVKGKRKEEVQAGVA